MRISRVRLILLFGSMACTMCLVSIMNYLAQDGAKEDQRTVDRLRALNNVKRRILGGRVLQVSPATDQEYIFSNKSLREIKNFNKSLSESKKADPVMQSEVDLKAESGKAARKETHNMKISDHQAKNGGKEKINLGDGLSCKPKRAVDRMLNLYGEMFNTSLPPFMTLSALKSGKAVRYPLPFGFKGADGITRTILTKLPDTGVPEIVRDLSCRRCIVIGNGGLMKGAQLGSKIDKYDVVFRLNTAPVKGYEADVGTKTTVRVVYPESSVMEPEVYEESFTLLVVAFKDKDITWIDYIIEGRDLSKLAGFWNPTAKFVPKPKKDIRLFNPEIIAELSSNIIGMKLGKGKMDKNVPTTGAMTIMVALRFCDELAVAGFGYDLKRPDAPIHYYSTEKTKTIASSWTHNIDDEKKMLQRLAEQGVIHDLTGGLLNRM